MSATTNSTGRCRRARGVERLPELALRRRALAERHVGDLVAVRGAARADAGAGRCSAPPPRSRPRAGTGSPVHRRLADDVERGRTPVARHLAPARRGIGRRRRPPACSISSGVTPSAERERAVAVVREEPVVRRRAATGRARAAALRDRRPRSGRTPGSAGAARSRGRRDSGRRARGGSRRAPRRSARRVERSVECGVVHCPAVYGLTWSAVTQSGTCSVAPPRRVTPAASSRPRSVNLAPRARGRSRRRCSAAGAAAGSRAPTCRCRGGPRADVAAAGDDEVVPFDNIRRRTAAGLLGVEAHGPARARGRRPPTTARSRRPAAATRPHRACRSWPGRVVDALREFPLMNATTTDDGLVRRRCTAPCISGSRSTSTSRASSCPSCTTPTGCACAPSRAAIRDVAGTGPGPQARPRRPRGRNVHDHEPGRVRDVDLVPGHQPAPGGDPRDRRRVEAGRRRRRRQARRSHRVGPSLLLVRPPRLDGAYAGAFVERVREIVETRDWSRELSVNLDRQELRVLDVGRLAAGRRGHGIAARGSAARDLGRRSRCRASGRAARSRCSRVARRRASATCSS